MKGKSLVRQALERIGKNWSKSSLTREKLLANITDLAGFCESRFGLQRIEHLKTKMIEAYAADLHQRGLSASTMADKMTAARVLAAAVGKQNIVSRENKAYGIERTRVNPQAVNQEKLTEIRTKIERLANAGHRTAIMARSADSLRMAFGLRAKESLLSKDIVDRDGKQFLLVEGAKGGRPRELEVNTEAKRRAVELVKETAKALGSRTGRIIPPELSLQQAYDAQRNLWRSLGGTRSAGANMHGERHDYARERKADGAPKSVIMNELGHGEDRSLGAYIPKG